MGDKNTTGMVKVRVRWGDDAERLWATPIAGNRYRLENVPFHAYGLSWRDIIEAHPEDDGVPTFLRVLEKSGHRTIRVATADSSPVPEELIAALRSLGVRYEGFTKSLLIYDIGPNADFDAVVAVLTKSDPELIEWEHVDPTYDELCPEDVDSSKA